MLDKSKIKLGIAPIAWTNDDMPELGGEIPFEQCISEMEEAGFQGTEVGSKFPRNTEELKKALDSHGLKIASQWFSSFFTTDEQKKTVDAFKKHLTFLKEMGSKVIVISEQGYSIQGKMDVSVWDKKPLLDEKHWEMLVDGLNTIGKIAIDNKMKIVYHHHMGTVIQRREEIDMLMQKTNSDLVWLLADTGHMYFSDGGNSPVELIYDYIDRIAHIHLKDIRDSIKTKVIDEHMSFLNAIKAGVFTVPGDGVINFKPIFKVIKNSDYKGWMIVEAEQDPYKANPLEYAKKAHEYIKELTGL